MCGERVDIDVVDVAWMAGQQIRESQQCSLGGIEELLFPPATRLLQRGNLLSADASPPRRGGM